MKGVLSIINEKLYSEEYEIPAKDIIEYINVMWDKCSKQSQAALHILKQHTSINSREKVLAIKKANTSELRRISKELDVPLDDMVELHDVLNYIKGDLKYIPHMIHPGVRNALLKGTVKPDEVYLDFYTERGRNDIYTKYVDLLNKVVNSYNHEDETGIPRDELYGAALEGFAEALNKYVSLTQKDMDDIEKSRKVFTFARYVAHMMKFAIQLYLHRHGSPIKVTQYWKTKMKDDEKISIKRIDNLRSDDNDEDSSIAIDHMLDLAADDNNSFEKEQAREQLVKLLNNKFSQRDVEIICMMAGWGRKSLKQNEIAKELHLSNAAVSLSIKKILKWISGNPTAKELAATIFYESYCGNLFHQLGGKPINEVAEALRNDDVYIMLEELRKWNTKDELKKSLEYATKHMTFGDSIFIYDCVENGFEFLDANYKKEKATVINFLSLMHPTESFRKKTDLYILEKMQEIINLCERYNLKKW